MKKRKRKFHKLLLKEIGLAKDIKKISGKNLPILRRESEEMYFTVEDRLRIVKEFDVNTLVRITVLYEIEISGDWLMIKMYDNTHNIKILHRHTRTSIKNAIPIIDTEGVKQRGDVWTWLDWARRDIIKKFWYMRRAFEKRSMVVDK